MILQALLDQVPPAPRHQRKDMRVERLLVQPLACRPFINAIAVEPLLAPAPALAFGRLDEDVAHWQSFALVGLGCEIAVATDDLQHDRARDTGLRAGAEELQLVLERFLGA